MIENEAKILLKLDHKNIINVLDYGLSGYLFYPDSCQMHYGICYMIMEYVKGTLLFDVVKKSGGLGEKIAKYIMKQLYEVLGTIHQQGIAHRDVKLENVMLDH